jgi:hypothetical protein
LPPEIGFPHYSRELPERKGTIDVKCQAARKEQVIFRALPGVIFSYSESDIKASRFL